MKCAAPSSTSEPFRPILLAVRILRSPVTQFLLFGLMLIVLISIGTSPAGPGRRRGRGARRGPRAQRRPGALRDRPAGLGKAAPEDGARRIDRRWFARRIQPQGPGVAAGRFRRADQHLERVGNPALLQCLPAHRQPDSSCPTAQRGVLANGGTGSEISDPAIPENAGIDGIPGLQEAEPRRTGADLHPGVVTNRTRCRCCSRGTTRSTTSRNGANGSIRRSDGSPSVARCCWC